LGKKVCIQGLGFVGFAMGVAVANARDKKNNRPLYEVVGVDLPNEEGKRKILDINNGKFPISCNDKNLEKAYKRAIACGNFRASVNNEEYQNADFIIIDINLDVFIDGKFSKVEFSNFRKSIETIGSMMKQDALVIIETTVPPGTTETIVIPILKKELMRRFKKECQPLVAHSYERVMPGPEYLDSIINFWRVFAGVNLSSSEKCKNFLSTIINVEKYPLTQLSSTKASELSKILENSYRATNIAFIDEWGKFAEEIGVDLFEVIRAIKIRPTHSNINRPGLGVGGYCLTKDPLMGYVSANQIFNKATIEFPLSEKAVQINSQMPKHTYEIAIRNLNQNKANPKILILGLTYRDQVGDTRYSASISLARLFIEKGLEVTTHDPMVNEELPFELNVSKDLPLASMFDAIIFTVAHKFYKELNFKDWLNGFKGFILDSNNVLNDNEISILKMIGIRLKVVGRGDL
tara:strand:+ start:8089 stop:9477 length:1389 start_codon:yes stop_codon:yes gene_type:complete